MGLRQKSALKKVLGHDVGNDTTVTTAEETTTRPQSDAATARLVAGEQILSAIEQGSPVMNNSSSEQSTLEGSAAHRVENAMRALGKLENEVISALFPPTGSPKSFDEIASELGMTAKEVKEIADNALRGLRGPRRSTNRISTVWN